MLHKGRKFLVGIAVAALLTLGLVAPALAGPPPTRTVAVAYQASAGADTANGAQDAVALAPFSP
ncbi:MAG: hypothetical protein HY535_07775 [Chloroflexi bacterium]|nr:hypothetical protein [Chloroflexota bacterium]